MLGLALYYDYFVLVHSSFVEKRKIIFNVSKLLGSSKACIILLLFVDSHNTTTVLERVHGRVSQEQDSYSLSHLCYSSLRLYSLDGLKHAFIYFPSVVLNSQASRHFTILYILFLLVCNNEGK